MKKFNCILLVDDDPFFNVQHERLLQQLDISREVKTAGNGIEALRFIEDFKKSHSNCAPEIIVTDINMPEMGGLEFLAAYNKLYAANKENVEVIVLTSITNKTVIHHLENMNVKHFITKPLTEKKLLDFFVYGYNT